MNYFQVKASTQGLIGMGFIKSRFRPGLYTGMVKGGPSTIPNKVELTGSGLDFHEAKGARGNGKGQSGSGLTLGFGDVLKARMFHEKSEIKEAIRDQVIAQQPKKAIRARRKPAGSKAVSIPPEVIKQITPKVTTKIVPSPTITAAITEPKGLTAGQKAKVRLARLRSGIA